MYDQWGNSNKKSYHPGLGLHRGGQPEANATQLVNTILQHNYAKKHQQREVMRIPERFKNEDTYKTIFHYLITNESKADVEQRLKTLEEEAPEPIKIKIRDTVKERDGLVRLYIDEVPEVK